MKSLSNISFRLRSLQAHDAAFGSLIAVFFCGFMFLTQAVFAQAEKPPVTTDVTETVVKIWEFSPYEVEVRYAFDASVTVSSAAKKRFLYDLENQLDRTFRAAWRTTLTEMSPQLSGQVSRNLATLRLDDLTTNELVLVVSTAHPATKTLRTFEAAVDGLPQIATLPDLRQTVQAAIVNLQLEEPGVTGQLLSKLTVEEAGLPALREKLVSGAIPGALLPRYAVDYQNTALRPLLTPLPWQTDALLRQRDKLFFLMISMDGDKFVFRAREIDCPMQFVGPMFDSSTLNWTAAARMASTSLIRAFAPIARVEEAESKSAIVRHRAGGMIVDESNPARIRMGDVLQPIVRRDDRNGIPTLLEPLSFTFGAVTASDGIKMDVNVYTYSGGPGLQGRQNRRTQRVLLRVRPIADKSDLKIVVRGEPDRTQAGCFVYDRHLLTDEFELLGRTDWRGQLTIKAGESFGGILPEAVRVERFQAKLEAERIAREQEAAAVATQKAAPDGTASATDVAEVTAAEVEVLPPSTPESNDSDDAVVPLNYPLVHVYIKSGDSVLAKLPMVPGLQAVELAQLPDDSLRLQSEAFVRGFQGEILDLIGLRNLLAARIKLYIKDQKLDKAEAVLEELRGLRNYNELRDELSTIQRRMLEATGEEVPRAARSRIDRMFQTTRDMLQKYLQDELVAAMERELDAAKAGSVNS